MTVSNTVAADHPLVGTWITDKEDSNAAYVISVSRGRFRVSGFCRTDGEKFEITNVRWNGATLRFTARMPSTERVTQIALQLRADGKANPELTLFEVWKKKDVKAGESLQGWSGS